MSAAAEVVLEVRDLDVRVPTPRGMLRAVAGVSFDVRRGRTLCLVGESGSGKSMTAMAIMDLLPPAARRSARRMRLGSHDLAAEGSKAMRDLRGDRISMVFQEPMTALNPLFTVGTQITDVLIRHRRVGLAEARRQAVNLLERVGLPEAAQRMDQYPHQQSGGQRQRILIAMALICQPDLLIADEPTTALDATVQKQLLGLLAQLQRDMGMGMIFITHDLGVVAHIADDVAVIYGGRIVEIGTTEQVLQQPGHPYTRALMACLPMGQTPARTRLPTIEGNAPAPLESAAGCLFRSRCALARPDCQDDSAHALVRLQGDHGVRCVAVVDASRPLETRAPAATRGAS